MSNNDICNVVSLEHCYTNLFSLIDLTGIKWLRLRERKNKNKQPEASKKKDRKTEDGMDTDDTEDDDDENEDQLNNESTPKKIAKSQGSGAETTNLKSSTLFTSSVDDPILMTHAKCMKENILCSWKRVQTKKKVKRNSNFNDSNDNHMETNDSESENSVDSDDQGTNDNLLELNNSHSLKKELWIFWYEKEEPPNLHTLISSDLYVEMSTSQSQNQNSSNQNHSNNNNMFNQSSNNMQSKNEITQQACTSNNGLPYESRSMLFKALHNLIEKSLIEKGFTRFGKWFVTPHNLNKKINGEDQLKFDLFNKFGKQFGSFGQKDNNENDAAEAAAPPPPPSVSSMPTPVAIQADPYNHVSYSFSFFLHGSSRVCTSVDMKMHRPIRTLNTNDLFKLRNRMTKFFSTPASSSNILPSSMMFNQDPSSSRRHTKFKGIEVILAPYGISANLLGYISNDSSESQLTCSEWSQFYTLRLSDNLPKVFVVGLEKNAIKLFYPNSFVFVVIEDDEAADECNSGDSCEENLNSELSAGSVRSSDSSCKSSDFDEENNDKEIFIGSQIKQKRSRRRRNTKKKFNHSSSFMSNSSSLKSKSQKKAFKSTKFGTNNNSEANKDADKTNKEMDSLELTIDSVARNFGTDLASGTESSSADDEMQQDIVQPSPVSVRPSSVSQGGEDQKQSSPKISSPSASPLSSTKSASALHSSPKMTAPTGDQSVQLISSPNNNASVTADEQAKSAMKRPASSMKLNVSDSMPGPAAESDSAKFKRTKSMNFSEPTNGQKTTDLPKSKSFSIESNFKSLTKKSLETNYAKFNAFFSKFKNKRLIVKLFLTPIPHLDKKNKSVFSVADFKKTRRLLKTYMNRKTKQKILRLKMRKRRRELAKEREEYKKQALLKKKHSSVKLLKYLIESSNSSKLKSLIQNQNFNRSDKKLRCKCHKTELNMNDFDTLSSNLTSPDSSNCSLSSSLSSSSLNGDNNNQENMLPFSFDMSNKDCKCAKFDYTTENQIRIKHKQIELITENLPLSFDILDKCQILSATEPTSALFQLACNQITLRSSSGPPPPAPQKPNSCTCSQLLNSNDQGTKLAKQANKSKFKSPRPNGQKVSLKTESSPRTEQMATDFADAKQQSSFSLSTFSTKLTNSLSSQQSKDKQENQLSVKSEPNKTPDKQQTTTNKTPQKSYIMKHLNFNTQVEQPFHKRQCYINSHKASRFRDAKVSLAKTIQLPNKEANQKPPAERVYSTQVIHVQDNNAEKNGNFSSSDELENADLDMFNENKCNVCHLEQRRKGKSMKRADRDLSCDESDGETEASDTSDNFYDALETLNRKELCDDNHKEDVEFRELKSLLLKFEKNAPNMSSDFDMTSYEELVESSNNNIVLDSDESENEQERLRRYESSKKKSRKKKQGLATKSRAEANYQYFAMDDDDSLLEMTRKTDLQQKQQLQNQQIKSKNSFSTTSSSSGSSSQSSNSSSSDSSGDSSSDDISSCDEDNKLSKIAKTNGLVNSTSTASSSSSSESSSSDSNANTSSGDDHGFSDPDLKLLSNGTRPTRKIDLNNLFNGVKVTKNRKKVKSSKQSKTKSESVGATLEAFLNQRPCLKNLTNSCSNALGKKDEENGNKADIGLSENKPTDFTRKSSVSQEPNTDVKSGEFEDAEEPFIDFNRLYDIDNTDEMHDKAQSQQTELDPLNTDLSNRTAEDLSHQLTTQPASAKQMTPPKSVESVASTGLQNPLSNQSQSTALFPSSAKTATSNLITSNSSNNIMPPTYDDLNNIFEEDSADENQQQQLSQPIAPALAAKEPVSSLSTFTTQSTIPFVTGSTDQISKDSSNLLKDTLVPALSSKAATPILSVVMTPPSLDQLTHHPQYFGEDLAQPMSNASTSHGNFNEATKSIELNDYASIINNKNRKNFSLLLIKNLMQDCSEAAGSSATCSVVSPMEDTLAEKGEQKIQGKYEKLDWKGTKADASAARKVSRNCKKLASLELSYKSESYRKKKFVVLPDASMDAEESKGAMKKQFKYLCKVINTNLSQIDAMKKQPLQKNTGQENARNKTAMFSTQTYIHYNATQQNMNQNLTDKDMSNPSIKHPMHTSSSMSNLVSSPQQKLQQQQSMQHPTLTRTNSSTNPSGYYQAMSNASMTSYTAPSTPQQQQQQFQQAPSPYHYQQAPLSNQSSYPGSSSAMLNTNIGTPTNPNFMNPGSVGPANTSQIYQNPQIPNLQQHNSSMNNNNAQNAQNVSMTGGIGSVQNNQNDYSMTVDQSPLLSGNIKSQSKLHPSSAGPNKSNKSSKQESGSTDTVQYKPGKLKPLDNLPILNKKSYQRSNLDIKFYLNSLCLSLNLSDTFNNCYRDINFDSCTLCVCNNNYLKGLDYSIYICNDVLNSNVDYYDYSDMIEGSDSNQNQSQTNGPNQQTLAKADSTGNKNSFAGLYLINSEGDVKRQQQQQKDNFNGVKQETHNNFGSNQQNQNQSFQPDSSSQLQQQQTQQSCTCGFSAIVNREILSSKAQAVSLAKYIKYKGKMAVSNTSADMDSLIPYFKLINLIKKNLNISSKSPMLSNQLVILDSNNCNGLFFEDYLESLNLNVPHSLLKQCLKISETLKNDQKTKNFLLNSILVRENYKWKRSFTYQPHKANKKDGETARTLQKQDSVSNTKQAGNKTELNQSLTPSGKKPTKKQQQQMLKAEQQLMLNNSTSASNPLEGNGSNDSQALDLIDQNLVRKQSGQFEVVANNVLDLFDTKYSCSFLGIHEQQDLYQPNYEDYNELNSFDRVDPDYSAKLAGKQRKRMILSNGHKKDNVHQLSKLKSHTLNVYDENKSGLNVLRRLITKTKLNKTKLQMTSQLDMTNCAGNDNNVNDQKTDKLTSFDNKPSISSFLYHKWIHEKKEIKSNIELTKSLKQIQPLLEETVQKKFTTAKMWDSFQGPLTWQHFCRLAFKDTASSHTSSHHLESTALSNEKTSGDKGTSGISGGSGSENKSSSSRTESSHHQQSYEPEPVPAFLVSSLDKEWMAISPYAVKFWDKLNLEPYAKQKNISYLAIVPDFDTEIFDNFNSFLNGSASSSNSTEEKDYINYFLKNTTPGNNSSSNNNNNNANSSNSNSGNTNNATSNMTNNANNSSNNSRNNNKRQIQIQNHINEINRSIKSYFKELTSSYELLRLGIHRPALRIAPDHGLVKVPMLLTNQSSSNKYSTGGETPSRKKSSRSENGPQPTTPTAGASTAGASDGTDTKPVVKEEPVDGSKPSTSSGPNDAKNRDSHVGSAIDVDKWFDEIQQNPSTNLIGRNLKSFAQIFKLIALKITTGYSSTLASNIQKSFTTSAETKQQQSQTNQGTGTKQGASATGTKTQFASTLIPTMSSINLDRTLFEELKPSKLAMSMPVIAPASNSSSAQSTAAGTNSASASGNAANSLLSNLLAQRSTLSEVVLDPINNQNTSSPHTSMMPQQQAQIMNYNQYSTSNSNHNNSLNNSSSDFHDNVFNMNKNQSQSQQNQNTALSQLTNNMTTPPVLFVYIIDPFDYFTYLNSKLKVSSAKTERKPANKSSSCKTPLNSSMSFDASKNADDPTRTKEEKMMLEEEMLENRREPESSAENYLDDDYDDNSESSADREFVFSEQDLKRLRNLGLFKAYLEMLNNIPDLFKCSTQFQILPLNLCMDLQQQSTSMYIQSLGTSGSNYSSCFAGGFGTGCSDLEMDYKLSFLKLQAFNTFSLTRRYFMSPAHNFYMQLQQQQLQQVCSMPKTLTHFGPAGYEEQMLKNTLLDDVSAQALVPGASPGLSQIRKMTFYSPPYILAPSSISSSTVAFAAANLFYKATEPATPSSATKPGAQAQAQQSVVNNGTGECNSLMASFIQLNMSNSNYGFMNSTGNLNLTKNGLSQHHSHPNLMPNSNNSIVQQPFQQQCGVLYVAYCLSEDQRYLLTSVCDENGELLESTSISIEIDERSRRRENHARRLGLRKLWEFIVAVLSQTCKPWRLVIGRLGRIGHSEIKGWGCLLGKKNLQRVCAQLKETCETCNLLGVMEMPSILSACLISLETSENICIYPEACSKEDKAAAAALNGQQLNANHAAQAHGVSCTHILTFPASAIVQVQQQQSMMGAAAGGDPLSKSDMNPMDDGDFFNIFGLDDEDLNNFLGNDEKGFNVSGQANEGDQVNMKDKTEALLNQEEIPHLDQQPLAVGYYLSTAKCGPLPRWLKGDTSLDTNYHSFKATLHIHNRYALENDELAMQVKTDFSHKLDSSVTYEVLRYVLERYNALSWLNIDPLTQDRKSCLPIHHTVLLQLYYAFKNYI